MENVRAHVLPVELVLFTAVPSRETIAFAPLVSLEPEFNAAFVFWVFVAVTNTSISSPSSSESAIARGMVHVMLKFVSLSRNLKVHG